MLLNTIFIGHFLYFEFSFSPNRNASMIMKATSVHVSQATAWMWAISCWCPASCSQKTIMQRLLCWWSSGDEAHDHDILSGAIIVLIPAMISFWGRMLNHNHNQYPWRVVDCAVDMWLYIFQNVFFLHFLQQKCAMIMRATSGPASHVW